MEGLVKLCF